MILSPIYAGIIIEKWTAFLPIKAQYNGLVPMELWNSANKGKCYIKVNEDNTIKLLWGKLNADIPKIIRRGKDNPEFPYRKLVYAPGKDKVFFDEVSPNERVEHFFHTII